MKNWFPVNALLVSQLAYDGDGTGYGFQIHIEDHPAVRSYGITNTLDTIDDRINTIFIDPYVAGELWPNVVEFISNIRIKRPNIVFVIYTSRDLRRQFVNEYPRFEKYFFQEEIFARQSDGKNLTKKEEVNNVFIYCDAWHRTRFAYDLGISFAGEEREIASQISTDLQQLGNKVFYDEFHEGEILGLDLYSYLHGIYSQKCRHCIILSSGSYTNKVWTNHERIAAQERMLKEKQNDYILVVKTDNTEIPGFSTNTAYLDITKGIDKIVQIIQKKLWVDGTQQKIFINTSLY